MMDIVGSPGTRAGLALRLSQFVCATGSAVAMVLAAYRYGAFRYGLLINKLLHNTLALTLGCIDILSLMKNWDLHNTANSNAWMYLIGDWILAIGSLAAVSSAGGVVVLLEIDMNYCSPYSSLQCSLFQLSVILGSMAWTFKSASAISTFFLLVSLYN